MSGQDYSVSNIDQLSHIDTSRSFLNHIAYANMDRLADVAQIYRQQWPATHPPAWVMSHLPRRTRLDIIDVGCGPGVVARELGHAGHRSVGVDLSWGMLEGACRTARSGGHNLAAVVADASALPFPAATFDAVLLLWLLYHTPDPMLCLTEARRVMRPDGVALIGTMGPGYLQELWVLWRSVLARFDIPFLPPVERRFDLDGAMALTESVFEEVSADRRRGQIVLTDSSAVVRYLSSTYARYEAYLGYQPPWRNIISLVGQQVDAAVAARKRFTVTTDWALLVCRPSRTLSLDPPHESRSTA